MLTSRLTLTLSQASLGSSIRSSRIVLKSRDENRHGWCDENRFECGFEFKYVFESRFEGPFEYGCEYGLECVYTQSENAVSWLWEISREPANAIAKDARADCPLQCCSEQGNCKRTQRQFHHAIDANRTLDVGNTTNRYNGCRQGETSRIVAIREMRLESQGLGSKREIQLEVFVGAKRECLPKLVVWLKYDRIDDDAEDERNEKGLRDCFFPQYNANPGVSPLRRRTERQVRRDSCDKVHTVFTEGDAIHVLCAIVSFETARRRVVQTTSRVRCDSCERSVSSFQGCLFSDSGQSQFKREKFIRTGCLMMTGIERRGSHECNKPG